ncbi:signal peptidase I [Acetivibrio saccincola]|uniref:Signal peptidase I n=2 Tax=Acetivibrio saccincola TaxID=1677857 RepID=A0A2K9EG07_9FIRM|nr:signal peptidase I [Acetivibrio saccincola]AUG58155.1 Signal peptidase I S [Acetivibrio saccincola]
MHVTDTKQFTTSNTINSITIKKEGFATSKKSIMKEALDWAIHIAIAVLLAVLIVNFVAQVTVVQGSSMENTLSEKDRLLIEKISIRFGKIKRGDIVTVNNPEGDDGIYLRNSPIIKRVIGIEGDLVEIRDGSVYVNGEILEEDYIRGNETYPINEEFSSVLVPEGYVYVIGDNRIIGQSSDSREFGPVKTKYIGGKAVLRFFPFNRISLLRD